MDKDLVVVEKFMAPATLKDDKENYLLTVPTTGAVILLERGVDFGIPAKSKLKKPMLYKSGAEKVIMGYGVSSFFTTEQAVEDFPRDAEGNLVNPLFFYRVRCTLKKIVNPETGAYVHITDGYGTANNMESACGFGSKWDAGNQRIKMARKRAMVDAALMLGQLSSMFSQDIENEEFMEPFEEAVKGVVDENAKISRQQVARLYTIAGNKGITKEQAKKFLSSAGYSSANDILLKDYDAIVEIFKKGDVS